jgi:hypothetical protein
VTKLGKLRDAQDNVVNGDEKMIAAFKRFGITAEQAVRADTAQLLELIATGARGNATAFADLNDIFGKESAAKMNGMLTELADNGLQKTIDQYKALGLVIDSEYIAKLDQAGDALERSQKQVSNFAVIALGWLSDGLKDVMAVTAQGLVNTYSDQIGENGLKGIMKAGTGASFVGGLIDGYKGVKNNELGSGKEKADAEKARDAAKVERDKAKAAQVATFQANQKAALQKQQDKAQEESDKLLADMEKKKGKASDDIAKAGSGSGIGIEAANGMASIGRYAGGRSGGGMYAISTAERAARVQEKIADIEEKSKTELAEMNRKQTELLTKIDELKKAISGG